MQMTSNHTYIHCFYRNSVYMYDPDVTTPSPTVCHTAEISPLILLEVTDWRLSLSLLGSLSSKPRQYIRQILPRLTAQRAQAWTESDGAKSSITSFTLRIY